MKRLVAILAFVSLVLPACDVTAEEPHLEFVRGLRARHYPDLALEYLQKLSKNPPGDVAAFLPLEMARTRLELAMLEPDLARRDVLYSQARSEFETFLQKNATHPLAAEANFEIARVIALLGKSQVARARQQDSRQVALAEARKANALFVESSTKLQAAIKQLDAQLAKDPEPKTRKSLEQARLQAEFEQGINLLEQAHTYVSDADILKRGETVQKGIDVLKKLSGRDEGNPLCWVARAWVGRCYQEIDNAMAARKELNAVIAQEGEATEAGRRLARYFRLQLIKGDPQIKNPQVEIVKQADEWLKIYRAYHHTPEGCGVRWELADAYFAQAQKLPLIGLKKDQLDAKARGLYIEAQKNFKSLEQTENDFTERARNRKLRIMLILSATKVGDAVEFNPATLKTFEEAHLWAQYEGFQIGEEEKAALAKQPKEEIEKREKQLAASRKRHLKHVVDSLHRALELADSKVPLRDVIDARSMLSYAYLTKGDLFRAAILGEDLARTHPKSSRAAAAAGYALQAYAQIIAEDERAELPEMVIQADRERLRQLAQYMEQTWPEDPMTDAARHQLASISLRERNYPDAVVVLKRITPGYPLLTHARYQLASATLELMKEREKAKKLTDAEKRTLQDEAVAALKSIPEAPNDADSETSQIYVLARLQLGGILYEAKQFDELGTLSNELKKRFDTLQLGNEVKSKLRPEVALLPLYALYGRVNAAFTAGQFAKVREMTDGLVQDIKKNGMPADIKDPTLIRALLLRALRANVQEAKTDAAKEILDLLQKTAASDGLGGGSTAVLAMLVQELKQTVEDLRKQGDKAKPQLDATVASFSTFLDTLAKQPDLAAEALQKDAAVIEALTKDSEAVKKDPKPLEDAVAKLDREVRILIFLAESYSSMDKHAQAAELLNRVPSTVKYSTAVRVMYVRELRLDKQFDKATQLLTDLLGTKEKPGPASKNLDARKERILLLEDQEKYAGSAGAVKRWNAFMLELRPLVERDNKVREIYYDAYYHWVWCIFKYAVKENKPKFIQDAAKQIIILEERQPNMGVDGMKERYLELLKNEPLLKEVYVKIVKQRIKEDNTKRGTYTLVSESEPDKEPAKDQDK